MAFKFPFTNYHELNLTWVLEQLKKLFEESTDNVETIQTYNGRLTAVEAELPVVAENAAAASQEAAAAASIAQTASNKADTAQENALQASAQAGQARQEAAAATAAAAGAAQAAEQAQATALNFDGRITQAEDDAAAALSASRSFEERVNAATNTANNAAQTATTAQGIATNANQNAAAALDKIGNLSDLDTTNKNNLVAAINEALENGGAVNSVNGKTGDVVLSASDIGYDSGTVAGELNTLKTALSDLDSTKQDAPATAGAAGQVLGLNSALEPVWLNQSGGGGDNTNCAPLIINSATPGAIASFSDGADNMQIRKVVAQIVPVQSGTGDPSPDNVRPITGWTGCNIAHTGKNLFDKAKVISSRYMGASGAPIYGSAFGYALVHVAGLSSVTISGNKAVNTAARYVPFDFNGNPILSPSPQGKGDKKISLPDGTWTLAVNVYISGDNMDIDTVQVEPGTTASVYEPFGTTLPINWQTEAGTIYGGTVTLNEDGSADVVNTCAYAKLNTFTWSYYSNAGYFRTTEYSVADYSNASAPLAEIYESAPSISSSTPDLQIGWAGNRIAVKDTRYTDASLWRSAVGDYSIVLYLKPKNQTAYHFPNVGQLYTFFGVNNVWIDTGSISDCLYPADTKLYIDGKIAELQALVLENNG